MDHSGGGDDEILRIKDINKMREQAIASSRMENGVGEVHFGELRENETVMINKENSVERNKAMRRSIKDYILDKPFRIRSYLRRRPIPLKRCLELDVQCGTKSFHLQINPDIDEAVYCGSPDLVRLFLHSEGLKLSDVCRLLAQSRRGREERGEAGEDPKDEDFYDSVKSRNKHEKEAKAESAKRMAEVEYLRSSIERAKKFKSSKEGIFAKIAEIESVCGVVSLTVIVNCEKELCCYSGDPQLITDFFTRGVARNHMSVGWNVRQFDCEEVEYNVCSVPACVVSRNTLGKWRQAALELFQFPPSLPLSLHPCPPAQRDRWMAELDLDPHNKARVVVCSLHFRDGRPTKENPFPTELLGEVGKDPPCYRGRRPEEEGGRERTSEELARAIATTICGDIVNLVMVAVNSGIERIEEEREAEEERRRERDEQRRRDIQAHRNVSYRQLCPRTKKRKRHLGLHGGKVKETSKRTRTLLSLQGSTKAFNIRNMYFKNLAATHARIFRRNGEIKCRICGARFSFTRALYHHVTRVHCRSTRKLEFSEEERATALAALYPPEHTVKRLDPKKKYVCAVCKSVCDLLGLFVHMKQVHFGLLCQYCLKLFKKVRDLEHHLSAAHRLHSRYYSSFDQLTTTSGAHATLACGECSVLLSIDQAQQHSCSNAHHFECPFCRTSEQSQEALERHIVGCSKLPQGAGTSSRQQAVRSVVLTGNPSVDFSNCELLPPLPPEPKPATTAASSRATPAPAPRRPVFNCADRNVLVKYGAGEATRQEGPVLEELPSTGTIFWGSKSKGISNHVKKEFKDLGNFIDLAAEMKKAGKNDTSMDPEILGMKIEKAGKNFIVSSSDSVEEEEDEEEHDEELVEPAEPPPVIVPSPERKVEKVETKEERIARLETEIEADLLELRAAVDRQCEAGCLFCQQCRIVWVEATFLLSHMVVVHQAGDATNLAIQRIKRLQRETKGSREVMFRYCDTEETFKYYFKSDHPTSDCKSDEALESNTANAHKAKVLTCNICQNNFLNYGSLISHVCSGPPTATTARARFACRVCRRTDISSFLEFQKHIREEHHTCEICFRPFEDQRALYHHCAAYEQDHLCLSCFSSFKDLDVFKKHLVVKHGGEVKSCSQCFVPTWPHVYHFCLPELPVMCTTCHLSLPNSAAYRVHQRKHTGVQPHACNSCGKRFISKSLLWKHQVRRHPQENNDAAKSLAAKKLRRDCERLGANSEESVEVVQGLLAAWIDDFLENLAPPKDLEPEVEAVPDKVEEPEKPIASALDAAIASIMPLESDINSPISSNNKPPPAPARNPTTTEIFPPSDRAAIQASISASQYTADTMWQAGVDALLGAALGGSPPVPSSASESAASPEKSSPDKAKPSTAVMSGLWNQDLMFIPGPNDTPHRPKTTPSGGLRTLQPCTTTATTTSSRPALTSTQWDLDLSESSGDEIGPTVRRTPALKQRTVAALRPLLDHDYCYAAYLSSQQPVQPPAPPPVQEMSEMDKILSNVAFGGFNEVPAPSVKDKVLGGKSGDKKKKKKKKKKKRKKEQAALTNSKARSDASSSDTDSDIDVGDSSTVDMFGIQARQKLTPGVVPNARLPELPNKSDAVAAIRKGRGLSKKGLDTSLPHPASQGSLAKRGPKPKYYSPDAVAKVGGVVAGTARPSFDTDSDSNSDSEHERRKNGQKRLKAGKTSNLVDLPSNSDTMGSSDLETDFSAEDEPAVPVIAPDKIASPKAAKVVAGVKASSKPPVPVPKQPALKLKIKLPPAPDKKETKRTKVSKRRRSSQGGEGSGDSRGPISKKMRESLALNMSSRVPTSGSEEESGQHQQHQQIQQPVVPALAGPKLFCYCQCPHDEVSEMIGCDAPGCLLEWFHFECVGILVPPEGRWYCPQCSKKYGR